MKQKNKITSWMSQAFSNPLNHNLNKVCCEVASNYFVESAKSKSKRCILAAIVPKNSYVFEEDFRSGAGNNFYYEYVFRGGRYLFIVKST